MNILLQELKGKTIVSWGGYAYFEEHYKELPPDIRIDYICGDRRHIKGSGYKVIAQEEIRKLPDPYVIISVAKMADIVPAADWLQAHEIPFTHLSLLLPKPGPIYSDFIKAMGGTCTDLRGNTYTVSHRLRGTVEITADEANGASICIGAIEVRDKLAVWVSGKNGEVRFEDGTVMLTGGNVLVSSFGKVIVGKDCMISHHVSLAQPDQHLIFDMHTGERINHPKMIEIGNHVWVGREAKLLGGAKIGNNAIIGAYTVTSGTFPSNVVLAGSPAKIIREGVIWARDNETYDWEKMHISECRDQEALKYLEDER